MMTDAAAPMSVSIRRVTDGFLVYRYVTIPAAMRTAPISVSLLSFKLLPLRLGCADCSPRGSFARI